MGTWIFSSFPLTPYYRSSPSPSLRVVRLSEAKVVDHTSPNTQRISNLSVVPSIDPTSVKRSLWDFLRRWLTFVCVYGRVRVYICIFVSTFFGTWLTVTYVKCHFLTHLLCLNFSAVRSIFRLVIFQGYRGVSGTGVDSWVCTRDTFPVVHLWPIRLPHLLIRNNRSLRRHLLYFLWCYNIDTRAHVSLGERGRVVLWYPSMSDRTSPLLHVSRLTLNLTYFINLWLSLVLQCTIRVQDNSLSFAYQSSSINYTRCKIPLELIYIMNVVLEMRKF